MNKVFQVHTLKIEYNEDPDLEIAESLYEWTTTEAGKFIVENSLSKPFWKRYHDANTMGYIYAHLTEESYTFYKLKFC